MQTPKTFYVFMSKRDPERLATIGYWRRKPNKTTRLYHREGESSELVKVAVIERLKP